ncbi:MAG: DUF3791 domain-containing protein [Bacillota bacterium]
MSKESEFFIYLIERYADYKNTTATEVLKMWNSLEIKDFIYDMYELYHTERLENAFEDIDKIVSEAK